MKTVPMNPIDLTIVGLRREGNQIVIRTSDETDHVVEADTSPAYRALLAIVTDPSLPKTQVEARPPNQHEQVVIDACDVLGEQVAEEYGGFAGKICGDAARTGAFLGFRLLRRVSR